MPRQGPRPHVWVSGPDPFRHKQHIAFLRQKAQANFRDEGWQFTFEQWLAVWGDLIEYRGRQKGSMTMVRIDYEKPWSPENARIVDRKEHSRVQLEVTRLKRQQLREQFEIKK